MNDQPSRKYKLTQNLIKLNLYSYYMIKWEKMKNKKKKKYTSNQ